MKYFSSFLLLFILLATFSCKPDDDKVAELCNPDFNQAELFKHIADNTILPGYLDLQEKVQSLQTAKLDFLTSPSQANLQQLRIDFQEGYKQWQRVAQFEFGPAQDNFLRNSLNNFPLNESELLENVQTGIYDFNQPDRFDKGFPALDFLLYGIEDNEADIVNAYQLGPTAGNFAQYLSDVIDDVEARIDNTVAQWQGDYRSTFINNDGTAAGSALSMIINGFNENYELIKREKVGIPSGVLTINIPNPDRVEAFYSGMSTELLKIALTATIDLFNGKGINNVLGTNFVEYLDAAVATKNDELLSILISNQFENIQMSLEQLNESLDIEIQNDSEKVIEVYNEISGQLVNIKTDLPSVLCVSITYVDNPSDSD